MTEAEPFLAIALTTAGSSDEAERLAATLVEERLAACVNVVPGIVSHYRWRGRVHRDDELLLVIKTSAALFARVRRRIRELHSYELPEAILIPVRNADADYAGWVRDALDPGAGEPAPSDGR